MEAPSLMDYQFVFEKTVEADKNMLDYAKMAILLAFNEYPNDDYKKCELISIKFEEKYGNSWGCTLIKKGEGDSCYPYINNYIKLKFNNYLIKIMRTR